MHSQTNHQVLINRSTHPPTRPTRRSCEAAALLGVTFDDLAIAASASPAAMSIDLRPGSITLIRGPSGSGKSTLLRDIERHASRAHKTIIRPDPRRFQPRPAVEHFSGDLEDAMRLLTNCGLGDAHCFIRRPSELSEGQRWRLQLALMIHRASKKRKTRPHALLMFDEFGAPLDSETIDVTARLLRRMINLTPNATAIVATGRPNLEPALRPDGVIELNDRGIPQARKALPSPDPGLPLIFSVGRTSDFLLLAHHHYRSAHPATIDHVLVAHVPNRASPVGVLTVSMPTLNARWRDLAWPGRYRCGDRRVDASRLNRELRCISRVIVDPIYRGLGVARRLVEHYLSNPLTSCTEAAASMGRAASFFRHAGMTEYHLPPSARASRLLDALSHCAIEPWRLALPDQALSRAIEHKGQQFIERELAMWTNASRATRALLNQPIQIAFRHACRSILSTPVAYAHTHLEESIPLAA